MVLDEITAFLDLPRRVDMMSMLRQLAHETGRAMLLSTHDLELALRASDRIWLLPKAGALAFGVPEDLVLSGAFEAAFASEGLEFEPERGSFRIRSAARGDISVAGAGLRRVWTVHALERRGYRVVDTAGVRVVVENQPQAGWRIDGLSPVRCDSIEQLLAALTRINHLNDSGGHLG